MFLRELTENFADGRHPEDKGDSARHGIPKHASISSLKKIAKQGGRKGQLAHWQANMRSGREKTNEDAGNKQIVLHAFEDFLPLAMKVLRINKLPKIKIFKHVQDDIQPTFGRFMNDKLTIEIGLADRHPNDILRTLAHELVHFKQFLNDELGPHSGETGSPQENEAHEIAGVIMRHFNKQFPHYLESKPLQLEDATAGGTSAGAIATVVNPHIAIGNTKKYGKGAPAKPPKAVQALNKNGTAKNALDLPGTSLFGGSAVKR